MDKLTLTRLQSLNQLRLTEDEETKILGFFADCEKDMDVLNAINTDAVERMVHVRPMNNVIREDIASQPFTRDELQSGAPETNEGYWQVPRLVE